MSSERVIPEYVVKRCLKYLDEDELSEVLSSSEKIKAMVFLRMMYL